MGDFGHILPKESQLSYINSIKNHNTPPSICIYSCSPEIKFLNTIVNISDQQNAVSIFYPLSNVNFN